MIRIYSEEEISLIEQANRLVALTLKLLLENLKPGVPAKKLDKLAEEFIRDHKAKPAFKGFEGYPATICFSINEEVVHGLPRADKYPREGDIVSIDLGVKYKGYFGDAAVSVVIPPADKEKYRLVRATYEALHSGISVIKPGTRMGDVGNSIFKVARRYGYDVVREYVGHGLGKNLHEDPSVPNYGVPGTGVLIKPGMVFTLEPMLTEGSGEVETLADGWTTVTKDRKNSAHFEHAVAVLKDGIKILSLLPNGSEVFVPRSLDQLAF